MPGLDDPFQQLLGELRYHAQVYPRWRAVLPDHGAVKGLSETDALDAVRRFGGRAEHSEVWVLPGGYEVLGPWLPYVEKEGVAS